MRLFNPFKLKRSGETASSSFYTTLYPENVRYALSYNASVMGRAEIKALIPNFTSEALYLVIKGLTDRDLKRQFLEDLTITFSQIDYQVNDLKQLLTDWVERLPNDIRVSGTKLAQLGRSGSGNWQDRFYNLAETCFQEDKTALPCLIAHTALLGYQHFVQLYRDVPNAHLIILMPDWMIDPNDDMMGYSVELGCSPKVTLQDHDECLVMAWKCQGVSCLLKQRFCGNAFFVDDTIHSGTTAGKVTSFWYSEYGLNVPDERIRVITDLRETNFAN